MARVHELAEEVATLSYHGSTQQSRQVRSLHTSLVSNIDTLPMQACLGVKDKTESVNIEGNIASSLSQETS
jgi:hypothetical protein